nr:MAG TPA: hypothetical protein [Caudoviricetes sp.]
MVLVRKRAQKKRAIPIHACKIESKSKYRSRPKPSNHGIIPINHISFCEPKFGALL